MVLSSLISILPGHTFSMYCFARSTPSASVRADVIFRAGFVHVLSTPPPRAISYHLFVLPTSTPAIHP